MNVYAGKISLLYEINPMFATEIMDFLEKNPEFNEYSYLIPTKQYFDYSSITKPDTILEHVLYHIAFAGVRTSYGQQQFELIIRILRNDGYSHILNNPKIQPKKSILNYKN